jgi:hypothetical protein
MPRRHPLVPHPLADFDFGEVYDFLSRPKTIDEVIEWLGDPKAIHAAIRDGHLGTRKVGDRTLITNDDLRQYFAWLGRSAETPPSAA